MSFFNKVKDEIVAKLDEGVTVKYHWDEEPTIYRIDIYVNEEDNDKYDAVLLRKGKEPGCLWVEDVVIEELDKDAVMYILESELNFTTTPTEYEIM